MRQARAFCLPHHVGVDFFLLAWKFKNKPKSQRSRQKGSLRRGKGLGGDEPEGGGLFFGGGGEGRVKAWPRPTQPGPGSAGKGPPGREAALPGVGEQGAGVGADTRMGPSFSKHQQLLREGRGPPPGTASATGGGPRRL